MNLCFHRKSQLIEATPTNQRRSVEMILIGVQYCVEKRVCSKCKRVFLKRNQIMDGRDVPNQLKQPSQ